MGTVKPFVDALEDKKAIDNYIINKSGIWTIRKAKNRNRVDKPDKLVIPFIYLSSLARVTPQSISPSFIVLDEFIDGSTQRKFTMSNYGQQLKKAIHRLIGAKLHPQLKMVALANPHTLESDLLIAWGIDFDWDKLNKGEIDIQFNKTTKCVGICIPKAFEIPEKLQVNEFVGELDAMNIGVNSSYIFPPSKFKNIYPNLPQHVDFIVHTPDAYLSFGMLKDQDIYYIKQCEKHDYDKPIYVLDSVLLDRFEILLKTDNDLLEVFDKFLTYTLESKIYYGSQFAKESAKDVKHLIDVAVEQDKDWNE